MRLSGRGLRAAVPRVAEAFVPESGRAPDYGKWFPRHQYIGMQKMQASLRNIDAVVEVHDARLPLSGRNQDFSRHIFAHKPHILVLNKIDLVRLAHREDKVTRILKEEFGVKHVLWTNLKKNVRGALRSLMAILVEEASSQPRYQKLYASAYQAMVVGVPNVGKSTLINALRTQFTGKKPTLKVGDKPGVTQKVHFRMRVNEDPPLYILDTPGVTAPDVRLNNAGLKLALANTIVEKLVDPELLADYLIWHFHRQGNLDYLAQLNLAIDPPTSAFTFLVEFAKVHGTSRQLRMSGEGTSRHLSLETAGRLFVRKFRDGELGDQFLDDDVIEHHYPTGKLLTSTERKAEAAA